MRFNDSLCIRDCAETSLGGNIVSVVGLGWVTSTCSVMSRVSMNKMIPLFDEPQPWLQSKTRVNVCSRFKVQSSSRTCKDKKGIDVHVPRSGVMSQIQSRREQLRELVEEYVLKADLGLVCQAPSLMK